MKKTSVQFIAAACSGKLLGDPEQSVSGVAIDSRRVEEGQLFAAVVGPNKDGHDYLEEAWSRGCRVFLVSRTEGIPQTLLEDPSVSLILTVDTQEGLTQIASAYLDQFTLHRVAVTGSVGKTSTKEMTARILSRRYRTVCTRGNLNTALGLCLTAFQVEADTEAAVFEMGMDRPGEIAGYCRWIRPHIGLITNVGTAHLERLGTREAIAKAKLEIALHMEPQDVLVFNSDSPFLSPAEVAAGIQSPCRLCPVGAGPEARYILSDVGLREGGATFDLKNIEGQKSQAFCLPVPGLHNAMNAALAAAAGTCLGIDLEEAAAALADLPATERRLHIETVNSVTLIDDTYNAGPDSMKAALDVLAQTRGSRKIAVLSDILELGSFLEEGHRWVGEYLARKDPDLFVAVGENAKYYVLGAREAAYAGRMVHVDSNREAMELLSGELRPGDVVLVKGSNGTMVSEVAQGIRDWGKREETR